MHRPVPEIPQKVAYYSFREVQMAVSKLQLPWTKLVENPLTIGLVNQNAEVFVRVKLKENFDADVFYQGRSK